MNDDGTDNSSACLFADFWSRQGHVLVSSYLSFSGILVLSACARHTLSSCVCYEDSSWRLAAEVSVELWSRARMRARAVTGCGCLSDTPVAEVALPEGNLLKSLPMRLAGAAATCRELVLDFAEVASFRDKCSHTSILTQDPWQHIAVRFFLDPSYLDASLRAIKKGFPRLEALRVLDMPAVSILRQQQWDDAEDPFAFPVLRCLASLTNLKTLVLETTKSHPNCVSFLSPQAFKKLMEVLPELRLEELTLATFLLKGEARTCTSTPMCLEQFLQLPTLRKLKLSAVRLGGSAGILDLRNIPNLEELDLVFLEDANSSLNAPSGSSSEPISLNLRRVHLTGLGPTSDILRPQLAKQFLACPKLELIALSGSCLQEDFLNECCEATTLKSGLHVQWTWTHTVRSTGDPLLPIRQREDANELLRKTSQQLALHGGELHVMTERGIRLDPRLSPEDAATIEKRPSQGMETYGQGMEWFVGGKVPAPLTTEQRMTLNNRF